MRNIKGRFTSRRRTIRRRIRSNPPKTAVSRRRVRRNAPPKMTPAMRAKVSAGVRRYFAAKRANRSVASRVVTRVRSFASPARRRSVVRSSGLTGGVGRILGRDILAKAGGAVIATFAVGYIMKNFGKNLPMASDKIGKVAYALLIPALGAQFVKKYNRDVAQGMLIGGVILAVNEMLKGTAFGVAASPDVVQDEFGNFYAAGDIEELGEYPDQYMSAGEITGRESDFSAIGEQDNAIYADPFGN